MGLFSRIFGGGAGGGGPFVSEESYKENLYKQTTMTPKTLAQLRDLGVSENKSLKLEVFFYTDTEGKSKKLLSALESLGYEVESGDSAGEDELQVITGWTTPLKMETGIVVTWTEKMVNLGYSHDCEFDGWGTNPSQ